MRDPKNQMWAEACAMLKQAEQLHRQFFEPSQGARAARWEPPVDVFETERQLWIQVPILCTASRRIGSSSGTVSVPASWKSVAGRSAGSHHDWPESALRAPRPVPRHSGGS